MDHLASQILSFLSSFNLTQHVNFPTHNKHHIHDLVIISPDCSRTPSLSSSHCSPSNHFPVLTRLSINPSPLPPPTLRSIRRIHSIDISSFLTDLKIISSYNTTTTTVLRPFFRATQVSRCQKRTCGLYLQGNIN